MSTEKKKTPAPAAPGAVSDQGDLSFKEMFDFVPEGWLSYGEASLYRPEECMVMHEGQKRFSPLVGIPTSVKTIEGSNGMFNMILLTLTRPGVALNREKQLIKKQIGDRVIFTSTYALDILEKCALHPTKAFEVRACPQEKISIGSGADARSLWVWDVKVNPVAKDRTQIETDGLENLLTGGQIPAELGQGAQA
jgi:hypothetical protein